MARSHTLSILLVENNPDHAELTLRAIEQATGLTDVSWVKDGELALDFLHQRGNYTDPDLAPRPGLILLDVKLPKVGGYEVLRQVKADAALSAIPVVMLTTSHLQTEAAESYRLGAEAFVTKPTSFAELVARLRAIECLKIYTSRAS